MIVVAQRLGFDTPSSGWSSNTKALALMQATANTRTSGVIAILDSSTLTSETKLRTACGEARDVIGSATEPVRPATSTSALKEVARWSSDSVRVTPCQSSCQHQISHALYRALIASACRGSGGAMSTPKLSYTGTSGALLGLHSFIAAYVALLKHKQLNLVCSLCRLDHTGHEQHCTNVHLRSEENN